MTFRFSSPAFIVQPTSSSMVGFVLGDEIQARMEVA